MVPEEVYILKALQNVPGVITMYDHYYVTFGTHYLVQEYYDGVNLQKYLNTIKHISEKNVHLIIKQLIVINQNILKQGIVHRKITPRNIFIEPNSLNVKISNFKSACYLHKKPLTWILSKCVAPPEYYFSKHYSGDSLCVWSLGLILYELLFRKPAFESIFDVKFTPCFIPRSDISWDVKNLLLSLLNKNPLKRITLEKLINHSWITKNNM